MDLRPAAGAHRRAVGRECSGTEENFFTECSCEQAVQTAENIDEIEKYAHDYAPAQQPEREGGNVAGRGGPAQLVELAAKPREHGAEHGDIYAHIYGDQQEQE